MTTINAAAAMHVGMRGTIAALTVIVAGGLAGCSSGGGNIANLLQGGNATSTQTTGTALSAPIGAPVAASRGKIAIAPVIGAPDQIAKQIVAQLGAEAAKNQIGIAKAAGEPVDYTLRGYIVAARESTGTKVSYIWDVTNPSGARVHRITGEEVVKGASAGDPWSSVSPQLVQVIAAKTGQQLNTWMPQKAKPRAAAVPIAQTPLLAPTNKVAGATTKAVTKVAAAAGGARSALQPTPVTSPRTTASTTGSIRKAGPVTALVPQVVGAPGDGSRSLASALRNELLRNGIKPSPPGTPAYRVEGRVKVGAVKDGQQPIRIDWVVRDPKGVNLGTVSQENKIPGGSLNGQWGGTASAAATAATQGILKLLPKRTASR